MISRSLGVRFNKYWTQRPQSFTEPRRGDVRGNIMSDFSQAPKGRIMVETGLRDLLQAPKGRITVEKGLRDLLQAPKGRIMVDIGRNMKYR